MTKITEDEAKKHLNEMIDLNDYNDECKTCSQIKKKSVGYGKSQRYDQTYCGWFD